MADILEMIRLLRDKALAKLRNRLAERRTWRQLAALPPPEDLTGPEAKLAVAMRRYKTGRLPAEEDKALQTVEQLRCKLLQNTAPLGHTGETIADVCRIGSKKPRSCRVLYHIIRELKPTHSLELGTCVGISAAYQATALQINNHGHLLTLEGQADRAQLAARNLAELGLDKQAEVVQGLFDDTLAGQLARLGRADYAFIDGHHVHDATLRYFAQILPYMPNGGIVVFDDIFWSAGMLAAWEEIQQMDRVKMPLVVRGMGIVVVRAD